jgi:murein L,D-transpeptidase YafK
LKILCGFAHGGLRRRVGEQGAGRPLHLGIVSARKRRHELNDARILRVPFGEGKRPYMRARRTARVYRLRNLASVRAHGRNVYPTRRPVPTPKACDLSLFGLRCPWRASQRVRELPTHMNARAFFLPLMLLLVPPSVAARTEPSEDAKDRVAEARKTAGEATRKLFTSKGLPYPPHGIYLRGLKRERKLEMWGADSKGTYKLVASYAVCAASGGLGPKRTEGDKQVPEGLYQVQYWNPKSKYHLSIGLDYPNASDRVLGKTPFGGEIMIHGKCGSRGCLAITDGPMEQVYLATHDAHRAGRPVHIHVLPTYMTRTGLLILDHASRKDPELRAFWRNLYPAYEHFERYRRIPKTSVNPKTGRYVYHSK